MERFSKLISQIEMTNKTNAKIQALVDYFNTAPPKDKLWVIAIFSGKRPKRPVKSSDLKQWCFQVSNIPEWLFKESYSAVGDLGETISLILPPPTHKIEQNLAEWMAQIIALRKKSDEEKKQYVLWAWDGLERQERFIFNKLIGGSFRIGVSKKTLVNALSKLTGIDAGQLMHSIIGKWTVDSISYEDLLAGEHINYDLSKPYPFCLAYSLDKEPQALGDIKNWQAEYKWDGIRGQVIKRDGQVFIWSRGEELVTQQFPELKEIFEQIPGEFVLDGEILPLKEGNVLKFNDLQKRLNRKNVTPKLLKEVPVGFYAYDVMEYNQQDIRIEPLHKRRSILEDLLQNHIQNQLKISPIIAFDHWKDLVSLRENSRSINSEGIMLKEKNALYHVGRKKGDWFKWKVDPLSIDAVMIYAQRGSGKRSGHYTDYTFAVRDGENLVTIAKAYSGLTNVEIKEISRFVRNNAIEKFGPVRTVKPELVFEISFEGIALSNRHKSGVALRFPRISRWRKDKTVKDIDTLEQVKSLIE